MNSDSKTVRGLSIAIVVLAALGILGVIAGFALIAIFGVAVNDPTVIAEIQNELNALVRRHHGHARLDGVTANG